jgi:hypothetical protein
MHVLLVLMELAVLLLNLSEAAFAEFGYCGEAKAKFDEIQDLVCGSANGMKYGLAHDLESVWMLLFLASVLCFPLFAYTCQIVKYSQQAQLGPRLQIQYDESTSKTSVKFRLALGGPYAGGGESEDKCLTIKESLSECLEIPLDSIAIESEEYNHLVRQVRVLCSGGNLGQS